MGNYDDIKAALDEIFGGAADFTEREIKLGDLVFSVMYISNYSSKRMITEYIIAPICRAYEERALSSPEEVIICSSVSPVQSIEQAKEAILAGSCFVFYSREGGTCRGLSVSTKNEEGRSVSEPETENVIRGAHEGFIENGEQNAMLLRRRLKTERLKKIDLQIGGLTKTSVSVMYIEGIADQKVIEEILSRLRAIKADSILDSGYIELYIQDGRYSLYPTVGNSERPDKVAAKMLEGRAAIIVDGSPVVLFYSTHTSEAYLQYESDWYYRDESFRTEEEEKSVVAVAKRAKDVIEAGGFGVIHDTTRFDETYSGSYQRSMDAMQENLLKYPTIQITVDVHRDAFGEEDDGTRYKPVAEVNGENAAQIMIMAGCDLSEDPLFPDWRENLHLALRLQQKGDLLYPGLFRPLFFAQRNYNMHATHGSLLVEVGTEVNTQREADYAGELLGETILAVLNDIAEE